MKTRIAVSALILTAAVCSAFLRAGASTPDLGYCNATVSVAPGNYCWVVCPQKDGPPLSALSPSSGDATITVSVYDAAEDPIPGIPAADYWLIGCNDGLTLCGGAAAIDATGPSDANGTTTIAGRMGGGGCDACLLVVVQSVILMEPDCVTPLTVPVATHSPDVNGDLVVNALDFNALGNAWEPLGGTYDACMDFDCDGAINLIDFTVFGNHWLHGCP